MSLYRSMIHQSVLPIFLIRMVSFLTCSLSIALAPHVNVPLQSYLLVSSHDEFCTLEMRSGWNEVRTGAREATFILVRERLSPQLSRRAPCH